MILIGRSAHNAISVTAVRRVSQRGRRRLAELSRRSLQYMTVFLLIWKRHQRNSCGWGRPPSRRASPSRHRHRLQPTELRRSGGTAPRTKESRMLRRHRGVWHRSELLCRGRLVAPTGRCRASDGRAGLFHTRGPLSGGFQGIPWRSHPPNGGQTRNDPAEAGPSRPLHLEAARCHNSGGSAAYNIMVPSAQALCASSSRQPRT
jgi:hypothetical protein